MVELSSDEEQDHDDVYDDQVAVSAAVLWRVVGAIDE
jgi:hypothetical protein